MNRYAIYFLMEETDTFPKSYGIDAEIGNIFSKNVALTQKLTLTPEE